MNTQIPNLDNDPDLQTKEALLELCDVFHKLGAYCYARSRALTTRSEGNLAHSTIYERDMDALYHSLPDNVRW